MVILLIITYHSVGLLFESNREIEIEKNNAIWLSAPLLDGGNKAVL